MCILKSHWQFTRDGRYGSSLYPDSPTSMTSRPRPDMASLSAVSNTAISCWRPTKTWAVSLVGPGLCHACEFLEEVDLGPFVWVWGNVTSEVTGCPAGNQSHNQRTSVGRRSRKGVQCTVTGWGCKVMGTERTWFCAGPSSLSHPDPVQLMGATSGVPGTPAQQIRTGPG